MRFSILGRRTNSEESILGLTLIIELVFFFWLNNLSMNWATSIIHHGQLSWASHAVYLEINLVNYFF